jgi:hypothetical protein
MTDRRRCRLAVGRHADVVACIGAELCEFVTVGIGLAFGAGAQVGVGAGSVGAGAGQHLVRIGADPAGLLPRSVSGLRPGGVLLGQPGVLLGLGGPGDSLASVGLSRTDSLVCVGAGLGDRGIRSAFAAVIRAAASTRVAWTAASRSASAWACAAAS